MTFELQELAVDGHARYSFQSQLTGSLTASAAADYSLARLPYTLVDKHTLIISSHFIIVNVHTLEVFC